MTLANVAQDLDVLDDDAIICARKPWTAQSEAQLVEPNERGGLPGGVKEQGFAYFLEVDVAREILEPYLEAKPRSTEEILAFLIYYAENDSFPP